MKTIFVDDEERAARLFEAYTKELEEIELVSCFKEGTEAIAYVKKHKVDLAVLDVEMHGINGIELGQELKKINQDILLIYITGYEGYAIDAFRLHAAAYLLKPYTKEQLAYEIETAKLLSHRSKNNIFIKTFGHFDVFVDNKPIMFHSGKAKELLALLVDRQGGTVTTEQIIAALWEDRPNDESTQSLCSKVTKTLQKELAAYHAEDILISERGVKRVDVEKFSCDLYDFITGKLEGKRRFMGEYLVDYSWAEDRMAMLLRNHKFM